MAGIVRHHGAERTNQACLIEGDRTLTWGQMFERAQRVANGFTALGVGKQDRVAFLDKNGIAHFDVFFGAALINAVSVDVNWRLAAPEVEFIVNDSEAKVLVVGPDFVPILDAIEGNLTSVRTILVIGGHPKHEDWETWVARQPLGDPGANSADDDVAFQLYSSGTTGRPKGVMLTNHNFFALLPLAKDMWELSPEAVNMIAMPLFHIGGGGWAMAGMYEGCTSVIVRELDPAMIIKLIADKRITHESASLCQLVVR